MRCPPRDRIVVARQQGHFPVLARDAATDELACVFRAGDGHYGLGGTLATVWSRDGGRTWSAPIEVAPRGDDVRNPAFAILDDGSWLLVYWQAGVHCYPVDRTTGERAWKLPATGAIGRTAPDLFAVTSRDRGATWSPPRAIRCDSLSWASGYGRIIAAPDGTLLLAAYGPRDDPKLFDAIVLRSRDRGASWGDESSVLAGASELALCFVAPDRLVGAVRRADGDVAIVHSADAGRTWSAPVVATAPGEHPADLCVLRASGGVLLTFGRRNRPLGCGALVSTDAGATWPRDRAIVLADNGIGDDLGYPSTVQLADGTLVTVMYFTDDGPTCEALRYDEALLA